MNTSPSPSCSRCGTALPADAPQGLCPRCLGSINLEAETVVSDEPSTAFAPLGVDELAPHFPQLEILEFLGRGGMGVVYKARQKSLNRIVALKLLAPERVRDPKFANRFAREAQALAQLNHPNIVTIHDFGQAGGFFFLLMEFVDGANLRQVLRSGKLEPSEALAIVSPICEALQFAHERGIVHRDIKPENLLLARDGRIKIADFGIAKMLGAESDVTGTSDTQAAGTPQYMAPEQQSDPRNSDHRADIYSLGAVLYELLTGEVPRGRLEPPSTKVSIDVRLDAVVLRALEQSPELRWQTAAEFQKSVRLATEPNESKGFWPVRIAVGITVFYALGTIAVLAGDAMQRWLVPALLFLLISAPLAGIWLARKLETPMLRALGAVAFLLTLPALGLGMFFLIALADEGAGWNPDITEAFVTPLTWLGMILLPASGIVLMRTRQERDHPAGTPLRAVVMITVAICISGSVIVTAVTRRISALRREAEARQAELLLKTELDRAEVVEAILADAILKHLRTNGFEVRAVEVVVPSTNYFRAETHVTGLRRATNPTNTLSPEYIYPNGGIGSRYQGNGRWVVQGNGDNSHIRFEMDLSHAMGLVKTASAQQADMREGTPTTNRVEAPSSVVEEPSESIP